MKSVCTLTIAAALFVAFTPSLSQAFGRRHHHDCGCPTPTCGTCNTCNTGCGQPACSTCGSHAYAGHAHGGCGSCGGCGQAYVSTGCGSCGGSMVVMASYTTPSTSVTAAPPVAMPRTTAAPVVNAPATMPPSVVAGPTTMQPAGTYVVSAAPYNTGSCCDCGTTSTGGRRHRR